MRRAPERFDSSEFHGIEKSACVLPLGCSCGVQPFVVVPDTQREGIRHATDLAEPP